MTPLKRLKRLSRSGKGVDQKCFSHQKANDFMCATKVFWIKTVYKIWQKAYISAEAIVWRTLREARMLESKYCSKFIEIKKEDQGIIHFASNGFFTCLKTKKTLTLFKRNCAMCMKLDNRKKQENKSENEYKIEHHITTPLYRKFPEPSYILQSIERQLQIFWRNFYCNLINFYSFLLAAIKAKYV